MIDGEQRLCNSIRRVVEGLVRREAGSAESIAILIEIESSARLPSRIIRRERERATLRAVRMQAMPVAGARAQALAELRHAGGAATGGGRLRRRIRRKWDRGGPAAPASQRAEADAQRDVGEARGGRRPGGARSSGQPAHHREEDQVDSGHRHRGRRQHQAPTAPDHQHTRGYLPILIADPGGNSRGLDRGLQVGAEGFRETGEMSLENVGLERN